MLTSLYAALLALLLILLSGRISLLRKKHHVGINDGGSSALARAIRVQANFVEYVPFALLLLLLVELQQAQRELIHGIGIALIVGRVLHAYGLGRTAGSSIGRFIGTGLTWGVILFMAGWLLLRFATHG